MKSTNQGCNVIWIEDCQVVKPEGQASNGLEVSLDGLVQKVHHFISGSLIENFFKNDC